MSRHKHRSRSANTGGNNMMNNSLGINPQMLEMLGLGNIDMGQLSGLFGNMGQEGFNLNNLGPLVSSLGLGGMSGGNNGGNNSGGMNLGNSMGNINPMELLGSLLGSQNNGPISNGNQNFNNENINVGNNNYNGESDENVAMLKAVRSMVDSKRAKFLDRVIELYKNGDIKY